MVKSKLSVRTYLRIFAGWCMIWLFNECSEQDFLTVPKSGGKAEALEHPDCDV
jgi:hypothetical protein